MGLNSASIPMAARPATMRSHIVAIGGVDVLAHQPLRADDAVGDLPLLIMVHGASAGAPPHQVDAPPPAFLQLHLVLGALEATDADGGRSPAVDPDGGRGLVEGYGLRHRLIDGHVDGGVVVLERYQAPSVPEHISSKSSATSLGAKPMTVNPSFAMVSIRATSAL